MSKGQRLSYSSPASKKKQNWMEKRRWAARLAKNPEKNRSQPEKKYLNNSSNEHPLLAWSVSKLKGTHEQKRWLKGEKVET